MITIQQKIFLELVRAGLWEEDAYLERFGKVDYGAAMRLSEEQAVVGLVTAGIEHVKDTKVPKEYSLQFIGQTLQLEQRNAAMNIFLAGIIEKLHKKDIFSLLVKGQGVAQCYERPMWRSCGDIDLLLSESNYYKAQKYLDSVSDTAGKESRKNKEQLHLEYTIEDWVVELHGTMHTNLSHRIDSGVDNAQREVFYKGEVRSWVNKGTTIFIPSPNNDVIFVFSHILQHFFQGGIGLRQICDLCRLLWTFRAEIDRKQLLNYLMQMGVLTEWIAFASLMVDSLGMSEEAMPFYDKKFRKKGERVLEYVLYTGNFGSSTDLSYQTKYIGLTRKVLTLWKQVKDSMRIARIFPYDAPRFLIRFFFNGLFAIQGD